MQMSLLSFLAPMDSSPDYQTFPFCSGNAGLASRRASKENLRKVVLACPTVRAYNNRGMCQGLLGYLGCQASVVSRGENPGSTRTHKCLAVESLTE